MTDFRILRNVTGSFMRFADTTVDVRVAKGIADAAVRTEKGLINPLNIVTFGEIGGGIFRPDLGTKVTSRMITGSGASAFDDAVKALSNLGERHGVVGISLGDNPNFAGLVMFKGDIGYSGGSPVTRRIGNEAAMRIDAAARRVLSFVDAPH